MKCINKIVKCTAVSILCMAFAGCGSVSYSFPYNPDYSVSSYRIVNTQIQDTVSAFASDLCVVSGDVITDGVDMSEATAAALFDVNNSEVLYSKNVYEKLYPASLTKVMTALAALKYASPDDKLTASENVIINESGAQVCGLKPGDTMTLDQALRILLVNSANDVAVMIAEHVSGSVEEFASLMNSEAKKIGATNSNFVNPHGLSDDNHYVTAYDLYLIFNEAMKYDLFTEIIHMASYDTTYYNSEGTAKELSVKTTNWYLNGTCVMPENVTVIGGKTGTTTAARHCLVLLSKDTSGKPYISIILSAQSRDVLYAEMTELLGEIPK